MASHCVRILALLACLTACSGAAPLGHDVYIWQRQWTPAVTAAIAQFSDLVGTWRVLGASTDTGGHLQASAPDWAVLRDAGKPIILVVRIEAQSGQWDEGGLLAEIQGVVEQWRGQGVRLSGLEIDHDSATARLGVYGHFLTVLRQRIGEGLPLSITGLPTWLGSPDLDPLLAQVDDFVLQVHGLKPAQQGLFSRTEAMAWLEKLSARTTKPFHVALPAYGVRIGRGEDGTVMAVESEMPLMAGGAGSEEVMVSPREVSALLRELERRQLPHLAGVVWFRLPTATDKRAWSLSTLRAVITGAPVMGRIEPVAEPGDAAGLMTISIVNSGAVDARLPLRLELPDACAIADGVNGYALEPVGLHPALLRSRDGILHDHHRQVVGWARCALNAEAIHVQP